MGGQTKYIQNGKAAYSSGGSESIDLYYYIMLWQNDQKQTQQQASHTHITHCKAYIILLTCMLKTVQSPRKLGFRRKLDGIVPTSLPELPVQLRDLRNSQKCLKTVRHDLNRQTQLLKSLTSSNRSGVLLVFSSWTIVCELSWR